MKTITIEHTIGKEKEGLYYTVPFMMPCGVEKMTLQYSYPHGTGHEKNVVDLGLIDDQGRFLGWSGSARSSITVGPYQATPGYRMTALTPGEWKISVGAYKIFDAPLKVHYELSFTAKQARWLFGDLHMHSTASDGEHDTYTLAQKAKKLGLDFIAVSDHNNYSGNFSLPVLPGLTMLPAVEWTHYRGHMNFFGAKAPFDKTFVANSEEEMLAVVAQAKESGALVSVNHPKCPFCPYLWSSQTCFDMMEIWNGPMRKANTDAIRWWHGMLAAGRRLPAVGGSDFHRDRSPVRFAQPVTAVYSESPAAADILDALRQGHSYIMTSIRGVRLSVMTPGVLFGDVLRDGAAEALRFRAEGGRAGMRLMAATDRGVAAGTDTWHQGMAELCLPIEGQRFVYLVVVCKLPGAQRVCAISNPVYFETKC